MKYFSTSLVRAGVFVLSFILTQKLTAITTTCISSGNWTNSATWDNGVPTSTDDVVVPSGYSVTMDGTAAQCRSILLTGTLTWPSSKSTTVGSGGITMYNGAAITGTMLIGAGSLVCTGPLSVPSGAVVTIGRINLYANGSTTIYGSGAQVNFNHTGGVKNFADVTINSGGTWNSSVAEDFSISGNLTVNGSFTAGSGDYTFTGVGKSLSGSASLSFAGLIINDGATLTNSTTLSVTSKLQTSSGTGSLTNAANKSLTIQVAAASYSLTTLVASSSGNMVSFSYAGDQTIPAITYNHITFGGSGVKTLAGNITVNGNIAISGSAELYSPSYDIVGNLTGTVTMASGTKMRLGNSGSTADVRFPWSYSKSNISLDANSEVIFQGGGAQTIDCAADYGNVTMSTGASPTTKTFTTVTLTVNGSLTINSNVTLDVNSDIIDLAGNLVNNGTIYMTSGEIYIGGSWSGSGSFTKGSSVVYYDGSGDQTVKAQDYYRLEISNTGASSTVDMSGTFTVANLLHINDGTVTMGSVTASTTTTIEAGAIVNVAATSPTFVTNLYVSGTINFTNTTGTKTFGNVYVYTGASWNNTSDANFYISGNIYCTGTWVGSSGTGSTYYLSGSGKTISGNTTISMPRVNIASGASYTNSTTVTISTELSGAGSYTNSTNSTLNIGATSTSFSITTFNASASGNTVNFNRTGDQDMRVPSSSSFYHLTVSNGYKKSLASADITVNGNLIISASTELDCNNYQITGNTTGTLSVANGGQLSLGLTTDSRNILFPTNFTFSNITLSDGSTVLYRAQNDQTISCVPSYYNLSMQDGTGSSNRNLSGGTTLTVRNDLDLVNSSLTLVLGSNTLDVNGDFSGAGALSMTSGTFNLAGDFTNYGTFTYGTGTVIYDGAINQTMRYTTYYNVTVNKTGGKISIDAGSGTLQVNNDFTITNGTVELKDKTLTVSGTLTVNDTLKFTNTLVGSPNHVFNNYTIAVSGVHDNSTARITFNGNLTVNGVFNCGSQNMFFEGTSKTIGGSAAISIYDASFNGSYTNQSANLTVYYLGGSGSFTNGTNSYLYLTNTNTVTTFNASANGNAVNYSCISAQTIREADYFNLISSSTGTRTISSGSMVRIAGIFTTGTNLYSVNGSTIEFNGSSAQTIPTFNYYNLTSSSTGSRTLASGIVVGVAGAFTPGTNSYTITGSRVDFNGSGIQTVPAFNFYHLTITNNNSVTAAGDITVFGNFDNQGNFNASPSYGMTFYGNFDNDGVYNNNSSAVVFGGTADQTLSGSTTFNNLGINKSAGKLTLNSPITINGTLILTSGKIYTTTTNLLTLGSSASATGASNSSYVEGPVAKIMASTSLFTFPTGKNGRYRSVGVTPESSGSVTFRCEYFDTTTINNPVGSGLHHVSELEYHQVDRTSGTTNAYVTLAWGSQSQVDGTALADLRVAKWNGSQWIDMGQSAVSGAGSSGTIKSNLVTSFSPFKLASISSSNPLPVEFISFDAELVNEQVELSWATASEINNEYFSVERSVDGINFSELAKVEGAGNSSVVNEYSYLDSNPINGNSYYRLKQVDFNGTFEYSDVVALYNDSEMGEDLIILFDQITPNSLSVLVNGKANETQIFELIDLSGKTIVSKACIINQNSEVVALNLNKILQSGVYILNMHSVNGKTYSKKMLIP